MQARSNRSGVRRALVSATIAVVGSMMLASPGYTQVSPDESMKSFKVADGVECKLFASEPMLINPCDMEVDAHGRVWITEGANYRRWSKLRPEGDRIVVLEDKDGDGKADTSTVFYQGPEVNAALGICVLGNKVIVSCSPNVFVFTDTDGDLKADKKEIVFSGISGFGGAARPRSARVRVRAGREAVFQSRE
jgi:putative membrane-bound dehydrogenase-like protein